MSMLFHFVMYVKKWWVQNEKWQVQVRTTYGADKLWERWAEIA